MIRILAVISMSLNLFCSKGTELKQGAISDSLNRYYDHDIGISFLYSKDWMKDTTKQYFNTEKGVAVKWFSFSNSKNEEEYLQSNQIVGDFYCFKTTLSLDDWLNRFENRDEKYIDSLIMMRNQHVNRKLTRDDFKVSWTELQIGISGGKALIYEDPGFLEGGRTVTKTTYFKNKDKIIVLEVRMKKTDLSNILIKLYDELINSISVY